MVNLQATNNKRYLKEDLYFKEDGFTWEAIKDSMDKLSSFYDNIANNTFTIIGYLHLIEELVPKEAVKFVYGIPNTTLTLWQYIDPTAGYKVVFIGDNNINDIILSFVQEREVSDESESESTK